MDHKRGCDVGAASSVPSPIQCHVEDSRNPAKTPNSKAQLSAQPSRKSRLALSAALLVAVRTKQAVRTCLRPSWYSCWLVGLRSRLGPSSWGLAHHSPLTELDSTSPARIVRCKIASPAEVSLSCFFRPSALPTFPGHRRLFVCSCDWCFLLTAKGVLICLQGLEHAACLPRQLRSPVRLPSFDRLLSQSCRVNSPSLGTKLVGAFLATANAADPQAHGQRVVTS